MFPLPLFPTVPDVLETMDVRLSLQHINTFMKNTLLRAVNNIHDLASHPHNEEHLVQFLHYATTVCEVLSLHLKGDQLFFNGKNSDDISLVASLDRESTLNEECRLLIDATSSLEQNFRSWAQTPDSYSHTVLQSSLGNLAALLLPGMANQRRMLGKDNLMKFCSDEAEIHKMIHDNLVWLTSQIDLSILLPFVLSHHDVATSTHWPGVPPEGHALVPSFVEKDPTCWSLAPFDPITQQPSLRPLISAL